MNFWLPLEIVIRERERGRTKMKSTGMWMSGMGIIGRHHGDCLPSRATTLRSPG